MLAVRPNSYFLATLGSRTEWGGEVTTASSGMELIALVGDKVRYSDGSESVIVSGTGNLLLIEGRPAAIVGSQVANGDRIISTNQHYCSVSPEGCDTEGFLEASYCP